MTNNTNNNMIFRHVIAALVTNEPGVLANVAGMFAARGFNIDSLVVGRTENPEISRMTIVVCGDDAVLEQVRKQLQKLVPVVKVVDFKNTNFVERDLMLVQVSVANEQGSSKRSELIELATLFRAKIVDVSDKQMMVEMSGTEEKLDAFVDLIKPFGIIEMARTGAIAMSRGNINQSRRKISLAKAATQGNAATTTDLSDLPPG